MKAQTLVPLAAAAAAQLLVVGNIAAAFAFQQKPPVETLVTVPVVSEIEQVECVRQDPVPYEPVTYQVPLDARQNIQAGCYMLGMYLSEYEGNVNCALMAYNLGATGAKKAWSAGTYSTAYTDKVWNAMVGLLEGERDVS